MRRLITLLLLLSTSLAFGQPPAAPMIGFTAGSAVKERELESTFDSYVNRDNLKSWMKRLSARPHHVGSAYGKENAEFIASLFRSWGYQTTIDTYDVLFPTPTLRVVELVDPEKFTAKLNEAPLPEDPTTSQTLEQLPPYNAYSADGDVTAELVYVNYGVPADYDVLERNGVDVKGKIVIARYGGSWRGIKPKVAAEHGAVGCIIYSDPRDDGYFQGDVYPKGAYRNDTGAQRGSVLDMPVYPGDPLTPGAGATKDAKRLDRLNAPTIMKIPVLPISYGDALPLLRALAGPVAPSEWRGALPITYHIGPGPARVHLRLAFDWSLRPLYNVIAKMPGTDLADQWIMRGNHHDAWVNGASDPISGLVAEMEEARAIGELAKSGWRPRRTIVYAAWDGEEPALLGSTEWVEAHAGEVAQHVVVYINSDSNSRGFFDAGGSHTLERMVTQVAAEVPDPQKNVSVLERMRARELAGVVAPERVKEIRDRELMRLDALGSGSDFTPFLQHAGVSALSVGYGGEGGGGSYHSVYDSFEHYMRFGDPDLQYGAVQAKTAGRMVLRLANADVLPFETATFASTVGRYLREVVELTDSMRQQTEERNRQIKDRTAEIAADPTKPFVAPKAQEPVPYLDFSPLQNAVDRLRRSASAFDRAAAAATTAPAAQRAVLDAAMMKLESTLTRPEGLPRRPWYRHFIYAPGLYTGYGVKTLPGVREAIEQREWKEANKQIVLVAQVLDQYSAALEKATR